MEKQRGMAFGFPGDGDSCLKNWIDISILQNRTSSLLVTLSDPSNQLSPAGI
jgi:hypothetical protein